MSIPLGNVIFELICFAAFISICTGLLKLRFSKKCSTLILVGSIAVSAVIQSVILLTASNAVEMTLTLLPITAYLPVIIAVHILSKGGFAAAVAAWSMGLFAPYILNLFRTLIRRIWKTSTGTPTTDMWPVVLGALILAVLLVFAALRFCRKPFQMFEFQNKYVCIIVPAVLLFLLISYSESMTFEPFIAFITFSLVLVMFGFLVKFLNVAMSERITKVSEQKIARQLDMQRQEFLHINQKIEQGRIYRHDMHHHLSVLYDLAENEKTEDIQEYISSLDTRISDVETERYCDNSVVNAALSSYIGKAKKEGIRIEAKVDIPKELPIDAFDICTILANALDNAVSACCSREECWISISSALHENGNFSVNIKNPCETPVKFGRDGFPVSQSGEDHGFGIKSIDAIVRKYNGILRCTCEDGVFQLSAVLFPPNNIPSAAKPFAVKKLVSNTVVSLLLAVGFLNFFPDTMQAVAAVPVIGNAIQLLDINTYRTHFAWGSSILQISFPKIEYNTEEPSSATADTSKESTTTAGTNIQNPSDVTLQNETEISVPETGTPSGGGGNSITPPQHPVITVPKEQHPQTSSPTEPPVQPEPTVPEEPSVSEPENPDLSNGIDEMNRQMEEYVEKVKDEFLYYFSRKYNGYVSSDTGYNVLRNDEQLLSIQFYTTVNIGSSYTYSRCFTLDKTSGKVLKLADLFTEGSDYVGVISTDILRQMEEQVAADEADYFIPGGIWSDEECFKEIEKDQNFYIDENNKLIIIFDEYEVAPGSMGMPQFTVEPEILQALLRRPFMLYTVGKETE